MSSPTVSAILFQFVLVSLTAANTSSDRRPIVAEGEPAKRGAVAGPAATCRWEPRHEVWCEATGWGKGTPTWEVSDTATGELLHRVRSTAARLVLSGDRWRDVTLTTDRGQPPTLRLMWAPGRLKQLRTSNP